jgi:hypothetical protein
MWYYYVKNTVMGNLLNILTAVLLFQQANRRLDRVLIHCAQLGDHPGDLGGLQVEVGLWLNRLASLGKTTNVLCDVVYEPKEKRK